MAEDPPSTDDDSEIELGPSWTSRVGSLLVQFVALVCAISLAVAAVTLGLAAPALRDDWRMDELVQAVVLDWRDFGEEKARARLEYELDHQGIGAAVSDDSCEFLEEGMSLVVECSWDASIVIPATRTRLPMSFGSRATAEQAP